MGNREQSQGCLGPGGLQDVRFVAALIILEVRLLLEKRIGHRT